MQKLIHTLKCFCFLFFLLTWTSEFLYTNTNTNTNINIIIVYFSFEHYCCHQHFHHYRPHSLLEPMSCWCGKQSGEIQPNATAQL